LKGSEPIASVSDPPAHNADGNGGEQTPHQGQSKIRDQTQRDESGPKDFALHFFIVAPRDRHPLDFTDV
jgi:hypothetical protein